MIGDLSVYAGTGRIKTGVKLFAHKVKSAAVAHCRKPKSDLATYLFKLSDAKANLFGISVKNRGSMIRKGAFDQKHAFNAAFFDHIEVKRYIFLGYGLHIYGRADL